MRVLSTFDNSQSVNAKAREQREKGSVATRPGSKSTNSTPVNQAPPPRESLSRSQILARLEQAKKPNAEQALAKAPERHALLAKPLWDDAGEDDDKVVHQRAMESAKSLSGASVAPKVETEVNAQEKVEEEKIEVKSDIAKNGPQSEETRSKLKHILQSGGFQFNEKEKQALSQILVA